MNSGQTAKVNRPQLSDLLSSELASIDFIAGTDESLFAGLAESPAVVALRVALGTGEISELEIRKFTVTLLKDFRFGELFEHDLVLAALATALSKNWSTPFAEEYIIDLAKLKSPEFRRATAFAAGTRTRTPLGNSTSANTAGETLTGRNVSTAVGRWSPDLSLGFVR